MMDRRSFLGRAVQVAAGMALARATPSLWAAQPAHLATIVIPLHDTNSNVWGYGIAYPDGGSA